MYNRSGKKQKANKKTKRRTTRTIGKRSSFFNKNCFSNFLTHFEYDGHVLSSLVQECFVQPRPGSARTEQRNICKWASCVASIPDRTNRNDYCCVDCECRRLCFRLAIWRVQTLAAGLLLWHVSSMTCRASGTMVRRGRG